MRPLAILFGLLLLCGSAQAQSIEEAFLALTASASVVMDEEEGGFCATFFDPVRPEEEGICPGFTNGQAACLVAAGVGVVVVPIGLLIMYGRCTGVQEPSAAPGVPVEWSGEAAHAEDLLLRVVRSHPRGLGVTGAPPALTIRAFDAETRQPVALGPLGATTATIRTADDLRALLSGD